MVNNKMVAPLWAFNLIVGVVVITVEESPILVTLRGVAPS